MIAAGGCIRHRLGHCLRRLCSPSCRAHGAANRVTCRSGLSKAPGCVVSLRRTGRTSHAYHCLFFRRHPLANQLMAHSEPRPLELPERRRGTDTSAVPQSTPTLRNRRQIRESPNTEVTHPKNRSQTSVIGDTTNHSPKTEGTGSRNGTLTSVFGDACPNPHRHTPVAHATAQPAPSPTTHRRVSCGTPRMLV